MRPSTPNEYQIGIGFSQLSMTHFFVDSASAFNYTPRFRLQLPNFDKLVKYNAKPRYDAAMWQSVCFKQIMRLRPSN